MPAMKCKHLSASEVRCVMFRLACLNSPDFAMRMRTAWMPLRFQDDDLRCKGFQS